MLFFDKMCGFPMKSAVSNRPKSPPVEVCHSNLNAAFYVKIRNLNKQFVISIKPSAFSMKMRNCTQLFH